MSSYSLGKTEICAWVRERFPAGSEILDVGPCDGVWRSLLREYTMDAAEIFAPNAAALTGYRHVYVTDIADFPFEYYDLVIFGDVIEHMDVGKAQAVLEYAKKRCRDMIVAVPFLYPQGELYGNPYEEHKQPDLTPEIFAERYPGFEPVIAFPNYCYYHMEGRT